MKTLLILLTAVFMLISMAFAEELDFETMAKFERFEEICETSLGDLPDQERAELLYEKAQLMFVLFPTFLTTPTSSLISAIILAPDNTEYKDFLCQVYYERLEPRDFNITDGYSETEVEVLRVLQAIKEEAKAIVEEYKCPAQALKF